MTIRQGEYQGYDYDRMIVRFTLMNEEAAVPCSISTAAMDKLDDSGGARSIEREAQFVRLRARIEARAAVKIDRQEFEGAQRGIVLRTIDFPGGS